MTTEAKSDIIALFRSGNTVFTFGDIALLLGETDHDNLKARLHYYIKKGLLYHIRRGIYARDANYDRLELATKIFIPSYISLETVLAKEGLIFQYYDSIFVVSYLTRSISCDGQNYIFKKIKNVALTNGDGLYKKVNYYIASKERAFMDAIYLYKDYYFDNLSTLNWDKCHELLAVYGSKTLAKKLDSYYKSYRHA